MKDKKQQHLKSFRGNKRFEQGGKPANRGKEQCQAGLRREGAGENNATASVMPIKAKESYVVWGERGELGHFVGKIQIKETEGGGKVK